MRLQHLGGLCRPTILNYTLDLATVAPLCRRRDCTATKPPPTICPRKGWITAYTAPSTSPAGGANGNCLTVARAFGLDLGNTSAKVTCCGRNELCTLGIAIPCRKPLGRPEDDVFSSGVKFTITT